MTQLNITPKQMEVLHYLSYGLQNKQIARKMGVTVATVKLHLLGLYQRLDVNSRMCALLKVQQLGLIAVQPASETERQDDENGGVSLDVKDEGD